MTTKMLINASRAQQLRVAIVNGTILQEYQVEVAEKGLCRGNIYRGVVANVQPSLNAAFIDIGEERHGFLPVADVLASAYHKTPPKDSKRPRIDQVLEKGKPILVQVTKDGVGQKGAALSTNLALAGRYLVFTPFDGVRGISRKAADDEARKTIRKRLQKLELPDGHGVIVRTNGLDQNQATLNRDLNALLRLWRRIQAEGGRGRGAKLIYSDQDLVVQSLRDYLDPDIGEVIVDSDAVFEKAESFMKAFMPRSKTNLTRYEDRLPLFSRYRLETQIDQIYQRAASLPSGGYLVIDQTEALTAIDVNSGRATRTSNHDESILNVNIEAAKEVARQLRLRDIGGLIVIDFIDMRLRKHQNKLERVMRDAMKPDKARWSVGRISSNGLLEINRQRIKQALRLRSHHQCPTCEGTGTIPTPEFAAMRLLSKIEARASAQTMASVTVGLHPAMADELQNHYRRDLAELEQTFEIEIEIIAAPSLKRSEERIEWVQREGGGTSETPARRSAAVSAMDLTSTKRGRGRDRQDRQERPSQKSDERKSKRSDESDESTEMRSSKSRRRRLRRRKSSTGEEAAAADSPRRSTKSSSDDAKSEPKKTRSRKSSADTPEPKKARAAAVDTSDAEATDERKTTRTRRRRRRRGGARSDADDATQQAAQGTETGEARADEARTDEAAIASESPALESKGEDQSEDASERVTRRRRSRRRRGRGQSADEAVDSVTDEAHEAKADDVEATEVEASDIETAKVDAADETEDEPTTRRRSRRRRSRRTEDAEAADEGATVQADADADADTNTAAADETDVEMTDADGSESDDDSPRTVTRRRRSRTRRAKRPARDEGAPESDEALEAVDRDAESSADESDTDDGSAPESIQKRAAASRERRRRRRSRSRTADDDTLEADAMTDEADTEAEETTDESDADTVEPAAGGNGHGDTSSDLDATPTAPGFLTTPPALDTTGPMATARDESREDSDTPPSPSSQLRWQWWGTPADPAPEPQYDDGTATSDDTTD